MAQRMRRKGGNNAVGKNIPFSIYEMNRTQTGIMMQSNNDFRIHEMLSYLNNKFINFIKKFCYASFSKSC